MSQRQPEAQTLGASMVGIPLSPAVRWRLARLFADEEAPIAANLLIEECGNNLPFLHDLNSDQLDRFRFAALKLSNGRLDDLRQAIALATVDWRDLLMAAGFGEDVTAHEQWIPDPHQ